MNKSMQKIRDEMADDWWNSINSQPARIIIHSTSIYKLGFDAAAKLYQEKLDNVITILNHISSDTPQCVGCTSIDISLSEHYSLLADTALKEIDVK